MPNLLTIEGIDEALANIAYKPDTQKARLLGLVRSYFTAPDSLSTISAIPPEELISKLWETKDPALIKVRKKTLSSLKSSINKDFKALADAGGNPEGVVLNRDNVFTVSEEKKNTLLQELGITPGSLNPVRDLFASLREMVSEITGDHAVADFTELLNELEETRQTIRRLGNLPDDSGQENKAGSAEKYDASADETIGAVAKDGQQGSAGSEGDGGYEAHAAEDVDEVEEASITEANEAWIDEGAPAEEVSGEISASDYGSRTDPAETGASQTGDLQSAETSSVMPGLAGGDHEDIPGADGGHGGESDSPVVSAAGNDAGSGCIAGEDPLGEGHGTGEATGFGEEGSGDEVEFIDEESDEEIIEEIIEEVAPDIIDEVDEVELASITETGDAGTDEAPAVEEISGEISAGDYGSGAGPTETGATQTGDLQSAETSSVMPGLAGTGHKDIPGAGGDHGGESDRSAGSAAGNEAGSGGFAGEGPAGDGHGTGKASGFDEEGSGDEIEIIDEESDEEIIEEIIEEVAPDIIDEVDEVQPVSIPGTDEGPPPAEDRSGSNSAGDYELDGGSAEKGAGQPGDLKTDEVPSVTPGLTEGDHGDIPGTGGDLGGESDSSVGSAAGNEAGSGGSAGTDPVGNKYGTEGFAEFGEEASGDEIEILTEDDVEFIDDESDVEIENDIIDADVPDTDTEESPDAVNEAKVDDDLLLEEELFADDIETIDEEIDEINFPSLDDLEPDTTTGRKDPGSTFPPIEQKYNEAPGSGEGTLVGGGGGATFAGSAGDTTQESGDEIEILTEDDVEFIDDASDEEIIEYITDTIPEEELIDDDIETIEEEIDEDELIQEEEPETEFADNIELVEDEDATENLEVIDEPVVDETTAGSGPEPRPKRRLLEVLSDYLEPEQALQETDILSEEQEEYISQILKRFTPAFVRIPEGRYQIGCPLPAPSEHPVREIAVASFHIGQHPVTNDLFELFVRDTGYETEAEKSGFGLVYEGQYSSGKDMISGMHTLTIRKGATASRVEGANWRYPSGPGKGSISGKHSHPVVQVSHQDALAFAAWAGKRLPTEEEWEAAARGTEKHPYPWGRDWHDSLGNFSPSRLGDTAPVNRGGREAASPFGVCDLLGNVYEWTSTLHNPANGRSRPAYILKGGSWTTSGPVTISHRLIETNIWSNIIGFRCAV